MKIGILRFLYQVKTSALNRLMRANGERTNAFKLRTGAKRLLGESRLGALFRSSWEETLSSLTVGDISSPFRADKSAHGPSGLEPRPITDVH